MLSLLNDLSYKNQVFSYSFRDTSCVEKRSCKFPEPGATYKSDILERFLFKPLAKVFLTLMTISLTSSSIQYIIQNGGGLELKAREL